MRFFRAPCILCFRSNVPLIGEENTTTLYVLYLKYVKLKGLSHEKESGFLHISIKSSFKGLLSAIIKFKFYKRVSSQFTKEVPAYEWPYNSRWSAQF